MHGFREHDAHFCPCGKPAVGRLNNCPCCEDCARIEKNLSKWANGTNVEQRAVKSERVDQEEFNERFDAWCKRRNVDFKSEREDWRRAWSTKEEEVKE